MRKTLAKRIRVAAVPIYKRLHQQDSKITFKRVYRRLKKIALDLRRWNVEK